MSALKSLSELMSVAAREIAQNDDAWRPLLNAHPWINNEKRARFAATYGHLNENGQRLHSPDQIMAMTGYGNPKTLSVMGVDARRQGVPIPLTPKTASARRSARLGNIMESAATMRQDDGSIVANQLAQASGVNHRTASRAAQAAGITLTDGRQLAAQRALERAKQFAELHQTGMTTADIAKQFGTSRGRVETWLRRLNAEGITSYTRHDTRSGPGVSGAGRAPQTWRDVYNGAQRVGISPQRYAALSARPRALNEYEVRRRSGVLRHLGSGIDEAGYDPKVYE